MTDNIIEKKVSIKYKPLPAFKEFHNDIGQIPLRIILAGYGSGKTYAICMEALRLSVLNSGLPVLIIAPTYTMLNDVIRPTLIKILDANCLVYDYKYSEKRLYLKLWNGLILLRSGDQPEKLKGINAASVIVDEAFIQPKEVYLEALARTRAVESKIKSVVLAGTPEQTKDDWAFELIKNADDKNVKVYRAATYQNIYLKSDYVENLKKNFSEKLYRMYVEGEFVLFNEKAVYYNFSSDNILTNEASLNFRLPIIICCDFNFDIMIWIICQKINETIFCIDEVVMTNANTEAMCSLLKEKINYNFISSEIIFYGDIAGIQKRPEAAASNWAIIQKNFPNAKIFYQNIKNIRDRTEAVNAKLKNAAGERRLFVNKRCQYLINDFYKVDWDLMYNKQKNKLLTHASDALSYYIYYDNPIMSQTIKQNVY